MSVPARAESWNTNERFVGTCCEFWQCYTVKLVSGELHFLPKLSNAFVLQLRSVPGSF